MPKKTYEKPLDAVTQIEMLKAVSIKAVKLGLEVRARKAGFKILSGKNEIASMIYDGERKAYVGNISYEWYSPEITELKRKLKQAFLEEGFIINNINL